MTEPKFEVVDDYLVKYDGDYFDLHKPSNIRSLVTVANYVISENQQLKKEAERYKLLSEIRQQEINNRILTIKEFITNCSDNQVRSALKKLFYSEVKEYDLSAKYRKLLNENEQLKIEIQQLKNVSTK